MERHTAIAYYPSMFYTANCAHMSKIFPARREDSMHLDTKIREMVLRAQKASRLMARADASGKKNFLEILARFVTDSSDAILAENRIDIDKARDQGMDPSRLDRLTLTPKILCEMRRACEELAAQPDPVGATECQWQRPNGLLVGRMRVPLGVIAMIYEARPNVTIDAAIIAIKAGNGIILKGGKEAAHSNKILIGLVRKALDLAGLPPDAAQLLYEGGHEAVHILCRQSGLVDLVIPRGGENLVRAVCECATVPVLMHYKGVCHAYIDSGADLEQACAIVKNSKTQRPGVCNALECLLVNRHIAGRFLPLLAQKLISPEIQFRACPIALPLLGPNAVPLREEDLGQEFHSLILAVRVVDDLDGAIEHIDRYGSHHTDIICTTNYQNAMRFLREVDSSMVAVNASTRFNDGGQLGLGAEIGISTTKLHAYGPMGVKELTTTKFVVLGTGQIRE